MVEHWLSVSLNGRSNLAIAFIVQPKFSALLLESPILAEEQPVTMFHDPHDVTKLLQVRGINYERSKIEDFIRQLRLIRKFCETG